jgi:hypothetical protein
MKNEKYLNFIENIIKDYYNELKKTGYKESYNEYYNGIYEKLATFLYDYARLHLLTIHNEQTDNCDVFTPLGEVGFGDKTYQVQLCLMLDKRFWMEEKDTKLSKANVMGRVDLN